MISRNSLLKADLLDMLSRLVTRWRRGILLDGATSADWVVQLGGKVEVEDGEFRALVCAQDLMRSVDLFP
jgi:hypothetical protein